MTNKNAYKVSIFVFMTRFLFGYLILGACRQGKKVIIYCKYEIEQTFQASKDAEYKTSKDIWRNITTKYMQNCVLTDAVFLFFVKFHDRNMISS